jgi:hypothetical protein
MTKDFVSMNKLSLTSPTSMQFGGPIRTENNLSRPNEASHDMIRTFGNKSPTSTAYSSK